MDRRLAAIREETGDARSLVGRLDELDARIRSNEEHGADVLIPNVAHGARPHAQHVAIEREGLGDRRHDHRDVVQLSGFCHHPRSAGTYAPNDARRSAQISPSVTSPSSAATIGGIRLALPSAAARRSRRSPSTRVESRRARNAASRSRWREATDSFTLSVVTFVSSPLVWNALTPTMMRAFVSTSRW